MPSPVEARRSFSSVPLTEIDSKMRSPVRDSRSASSPPRDEIVSAMRVPASSSLSEISWPRRPSSPSSASALLFSASLTSPICIAIVSAVRPPASVIARVISSVRPSKPAIRSRATAERVSFTSWPRCAIVSAMARPVADSVSLISALRARRASVTSPPVVASDTATSLTVSARPRHQVLAARRHLVDHRLAGAGERNGDLVAPLGQGRGDAVARRRDVLGDRFRREAKVLGQRLLGADDRRPDPFRIDDDGFALPGEIVDQRAHPRFVVAVRTLQRGDLVVDEELQFAGTGERAFDAVADRGNLAANGLADVGDVFGREVLRLRQALRNLGDRARDVAHLLRAPDQRARRPR